MSTAVAEASRVLHTVPGRVRVHIPGWPTAGKRALETKLRCVQGVRSAQANAVTGNILIQYDPSITDEQSLLKTAGILANEVSREAEASSEGAAAAAETAPPPTIREQHGKQIRARIAVRGLDRDPHLAKRVVEALERHPGVHASANLLTGRVLVEFTEHEVELEDLIADVAGIELPELPGETRPSYPLDRGPLIQSIVRLSGATLGLGLLTTRRLLQTQEPLPGATVASNIASTIAIIQGIPAIRYGLRKLLGSTVSSLLINIPNLITLSVAERQTGLIVNASESLRLLTATYARRQAWKRYEAGVEDAPSAQPDAVIHLESGEHAPLAARVLEGTGTAIGRDNTLQPVTPGKLVPPGARLYGGPFELRLEAEESFQAFIPTPHPTPATPSLFDRYLAAMGPASILYALATGILTRSIARTLTALLLVTPRTAMVGAENAEQSASARMIRAGATVIGTRTNRTYRLPDAIYLDGVRLLTDGFELHHAQPLTGDFETADILALAASVATAAGSPWGGTFRAASSVPAANGSFDGKVASGEIEQVRYILGPVEDWSALPEAGPLRQVGDYVLVLRNEQGPIGLFGIHPRLAADVGTLVETCKRYHVEIGAIASGDQLVVQAIARRANIPLIDNPNENAVEIIRAKQQSGARVAYVSDNAGAAAGFATCDLAIGLGGCQSHLAARADVLAPDLTTVAAILDACRRRNATDRDAVGLSLISNLIGLFWGFQGQTTFAHASRAVSITSLIAIADGWLRQLGGERQGAALAHLFDPHPERWGQRSAGEVLQLMRTAESGLTPGQVAERTHAAISRPQRNQLLSLLLEQINSPLVAIYGAGAALSLLSGVIGDAIIITFTIAANVAISAWQEYKANRVSEALQQLGASTATVLRDGQKVIIPANSVVPGDILLLAPGDRIAADARILSAHSLEVDEAALTGESVPVPKMAEGGTAASRVVLEGSDVTTGTGRAVVVAVGKQTRMGATAAALAVEETEQNPLGTRLNSMMRVLLPLSIGGGGIVLGSGLLRRQPLAALLPLGVTMVLAAIPEGLPLLANLGEAAVARRLASRNAVVRRLSSVEALGRVDIACTDKTGTLTRGQLSLSMVADYEQSTRELEKLSPELRRVLVTAALASPHPEAQDAQAHPTDKAIIRGAQAAGLSDEVHAMHQAELPFDPVRSFHATVAEGRLCVKGAPEALLPRCRWAMELGEQRPLNEQNEQEWIERARHFAEQGLRVLLVAQGPGDTPLNNPQGLTALGFVGISDPLRPHVAAAVQRCREAGVRVIMITGDHPATARAIAREAGLLDTNGVVLTGPEILELSNGELDRRLEQATVIARATPLDKLRIIQSLQRNGHVIAMTGDGVNDAPALRLANVGVAMGRAGTEVARQASDLVLVDDDFSTLVEALVEGRSYWRNIRRALGLLLGGNLGELGMVVGASVLTPNYPLNPRQLLALNVITDLLPATAVALQQPESRSLAGLNREGQAALGKPLRNDIFRRALTSAGPSLIAYLITRGSAPLPQARAVAYSSSIMTQLAQTLDAGRAEGRLTGSVVGAVAGSTGMLAATLAIPPLRNFLHLAVPGPLGWTLIGVGTISSVIANRLTTPSPTARPVLSAETSQTATPESGG